MKLVDCGIPPAKRFVFYDQIHTTGMDIQHKLDATAVLTLGKDMTFRDFAQGAYRMRGIGKGQRVHLFVIPEVHELIVKVAVDAGLPRRRETVASLAPIHMLSDVAAWLVVNSINSEQIQYNMLQVVHRRIRHATVRQGNVCSVNRPRTKSDSGLPASCTTRTQ